MISRFITVFLKVILIQVIQVIVVNALPSSIFFHFRADNVISGSQWADISGNGRHAFTYGTISQAYDEDFRPYLYGGPSAILNFQVPPGRYTLFHRTKYIGGSMSRIFTGSSLSWPCNWLSGFHHGRAGVAFHSAWITDCCRDSHGTDWVISSDQYNLYRSNGVQRSTTNGVFGSLCDLGVNTLYSEQSHWAISEVIMYDRELSLPEIHEVEAYLEVGITTTPSTSPSLSTVMPTSSLPSTMPTYKPTIASTSIPTSTPNSVPTATPTDMPTTSPTVTPCLGYNVMSPAWGDSVSITTVSRSLAVRWEAANCTSNFVHFEFCFRLSGGQLVCWNTIHNADIFESTGAVLNTGDSSLTFMVAPDSGSGFYLLRVVDDVTPLVHGDSAFFFVDFSTLTAMPTVTPSVMPTSLSTSIPTSPTMSPTELPTSSTTVEILSSSHEKDYSVNLAPFYIVIGILAVLCLLLLIHQLLLIFHLSFHHNLFLWFMWGGKSRRSETNFQITTTEEYTSTATGETNCSQSDCTRSRSKYSSSRPSAPPGKMLVEATAVTESNESLIDEF
mmetsp:Transcript_16036/g.24180  ORF Transcript_16036/g.24180 Transcript_16036/m.24180 type:complete len:558 (-) Transcript_16036:85-1758(-)|eukprot:CAMPEP_0185028904 /NCGR_PEP_ID=MMETSP1103-20130426/14972_1 /TAXON_ID=36769 /ORGANISM="Paraphysomonas bandaiensis, Strain Caron Lab Isolate" /LENGTH=557 /DNA_ID=CAMNT_0027563479 /DNA_START=95 /DNA_END=1768 /DNA_ORIENTATION=-